MIDAQQENGTDEAPAMDVRWEGKLQLMEIRAKRLTDAGLDWKDFSISAGDIMRLIEEREGLKRVRAIHRPRQCGCSDPKCTAHTLADCCYGEEWPCPTIKALG